MSDRVVFSLEGIPGLTDALERASADVVRQVMDLVDETARDIQAEAKSRIDDDEGDLRDAIIVVGKGKSRVVGIAETVVTRRGSNRVHQRPFIYGYVLENGSVKQPARAFMRPAADIHLPRFESRLGGIEGLVI